jgi:hypothetical protein
VDPSNLKKYNNFQAWLDDYELLQEKYPDWWEFKPDDIDYSDEDNEPLFDNASSRMRWLVACREFEAAVKKVTKCLKKRHEHHWKSHQKLASYLSSKEFRRCFADTIAYAFKECPNLVNIVIASPVPGQKDVKA